MIPIGLCGPAGAGKDTVAEMVTTYLFRRKVMRQGFADKLKLQVARLFKPDADLAEALVFCNWLKEHGKVRIEPQNVGTVDWANHLPEGFDFEVEGRPFLQRDGTEGHRDVFGQDFWLDAVLPPGRDNCDILLIPDTRFANEAQRILERGGQIWKVERPGIEKVASHSSETGIDPSVLSLIIVNDGTKSDLRAKVFDTIMNRGLLV